MLFLITSCFLGLIMYPGWLSLATLLFYLYGFPLIIYHIHQYFYPLKEGISYLKGDQYNPWWGTQQIQILYNTFPVLEKILHLIPGLFSIWLRLWGAKIGKNVYWVPTVSIIDRGLLEIGDGVIMGHQSSICAHSIKPKKNNIVVFVEKIKIGNQAFIGGDVRISSGVEIEANTFVPYGKWIYPQVKLTANHLSSEPLHSVSQTHPDESGENFHFDC
ncbi:MAG: acyl transferase [Crocosphaera sp.]|nr:acyl transferase [Crocosphaera sp.]